MPLALPRRTITLLVPLLAALMPTVMAQATQQPSAGHFNVANTHSPQVERQLAGPAPRTPPVKGAALGVDVSSFQHPNGAPIDWPQVAAAGYRFAFIKATEGSYYVNPYFASDAAGAEAAGMLVAAYHFANPGYSSGALQADFALDNSGDVGLGADGDSLPFIADLEYDPYGTECYGLTPRQMVAWIGAFTAEIYRRTGQHPVIYTTADWWDTCTGSSTAFGADPLWEAYYPGNGDPPAPTPPAGWPTWTYWQYTSSGSVKGIKGSHTDLSVLNLSALEVAQPASQSDQAGATVSTAVKSLSSPAGPALSYSASGLPAGLSINSATGLITGMLPSSPGSAEAMVTVSGAGLPPVTDNFTWYVHGPVQLAIPPPQSGRSGSPQLLAIGASDSLPGCTLTFTATGLPPGLSIGPCGVISGWLGKPGTYHPQITVSDSAGQIGAGSFYWTVGPPAGGPAGHLTAAGGGCLTVVKGQVQVTKACQHIVSQRWTLSPDGALVLGGDCLAVNGNTSLATIPLALRACSGTVFQDWQPGPSGQLVNLSTGACLSVAKTSVAVLEACDGTGAQQWTLPPGPLSSAIPGWCASAWHAAGTPAGPVSMRQCGGADATSWTAESNGTLRSAGDCLTVTYPAVNGAPVAAAPCRASAVASQQWQLLPAGPAAEQLLNPSTGLCLADQGDQTDGAQLSLGHCTTTDQGTVWQVS
jgi:GH25 family lysozyme M1 (1,4-beta-N-acetylmuramidase)